jgi:hypothetical protein
MPDPVAVQSEANVLAGRFLTSCLNPTLDSPKNDSAGMTCLKKGSLVHTCSQLPSMLHSKLHLARTLDLQHVTHAR